MSGSDRLSEIGNIKIYSEDITKPYDEAKLFLPADPNEAKLVQFSYSLGKDPINFDGGLWEIVLTYNANTFELLSF